MPDKWDNIGTALNLIFKLVIPLGLLVVTWVTQHCMIRARRKYLAEREAYYRERILLTNLKQYPAGECFAPSLVTGAVVIAGNYFVTFVSAFKHLFGGEMKGYTGMCADARRLALVRMLQDAEAIGADAVCNIRFETSSISGESNRQKTGGVELIAYGTAYRRIRA